jgi:glycosidase
MENVQMKNMKFQLSGLLLCMLLAGSLMGCGKKGSSPEPTPTPLKPTYTDPAQYGTPFGSVPATKDMVIYEVNVSTYTPTTFASVQARLDSIKALGVNVIWLMPTYPVGVVKAVPPLGSPYAVKDYNGVNAEFGSITDLRNLVDAAHSRGMAVIFDWVANDTSWDNPWITDHKSWYLQDASGNVIIPPGTNYADVAALNFANTDMRTAMIRAMKYWIFTANIDGYRCDFADNVPADFWKQALDTLSTIKTHKLIYLAEGTASAEITSGFQLDFAFSYYNTLKGVFAGTQAPGTLFTTNTSEISSIPSNGVKLRYITNHDDASSDGSTITEYNGKQGALAAFVLASYMGGVPLIYDSQEVGYANPISIFNDVPVNYTLNANPDIAAAYKKILAFRAANEAVKIGTLTQYNDNNVVAFEKVSGADDVLIMVNARNSVSAFNIPAALQNTTWTNGLAGGTVTLGSSYNFQPYTYLVLKKN